MSKVKIEGNASGTGTLTISAPNTNTDRSLTLPDGAGEILTNASTLSSSNLSGSLASSIMPSGSIIQVQTNAIIGRTTITSSGSWTATNYTQGIDPTSSSNDIFVNIMVPVRVAGGSIMRGGLRVIRTVGGTDTTVHNKDGFTENIHVRNADNEHDQTSTISFVDSPSTTSTVTYKLEAYLMTGTQFYIWESGYGGFMTLMEIVG